MRRRSGFLVAFLLLLACAAAFLVRVGRPPWEPYRIYVYDSQYHYRLALLTDHDFPRIPDFDPYVDYPNGARIPWPFLQSFIAAGIGRLLGEGQERLRAVCFFLPAVAGAL